MPTHKSKEETKKHSDAAFSAAGFSNHTLCVKSCKDDYDSCVTGDCKAKLRDCLGACPDGEISQEQIRILLSKLD